ncbi:MAG: hypothetical protein HY700_07460 [Gemmatimonadetes bacterium]|nr:hypothetical protein [Gemmatimonadota bacterium]
MLKNLAVMIALALALPAAAAAQHEDHDMSGPAPQAPTILAPDVQIAGAVLAAPEVLRAGAAVLGYAPDGKLVELRKGTNELICLADDPKAEQFHVACYYRGLEPLMARGRELLAQGVTGPRRDSIRNADIVAGRVKMPVAGAVYTLSARKACFDTATKTLCDRVRPVHSVYVAFASTENTGLLDHATDAYTPYLMDAGTPKAHIMFGEHGH